MPRRRRDVARTCRCADCGTGGAAPCAATAASAIEPPSTRNRSIQPSPSAVEEHGAGAHGLGQILVGAGAVGVADGDAGGRGDVLEHGRAPPAPVRRRAPRDDCARGAGMATSAAQRPAASGGHADRVTSASFDTARRTPARASSPRTAAAAPPSRPSECARRRRAPAAPRRPGRRAAAHGRARSAPRRGWRRAARRTAAARSRRRRRPDRRAAAPPTQTRAALAGSTSAAARYSTSASSRRSCA